MKIKNFFKKTGGFIKKNIYYIILFVCISGIATMILLATLNGGKTDNNINNNNNNNINNNNNNNNNNNQDPPVGGDPIYFIVPVNGFDEGMLFSGDEFWLNVTLGDYRTHKAKDFLTEGSSEVYACYDGIVESVYKNAREGNVIVIRHNDELKTTYKSLSDDVMVKAGDTVKKGDKIGYTSDSMGDEFKEGNHLHLEVLYKGKKVNPETFFESGEK